MSTTDDIIDIQQWFSERGYKTNYPVRVVQFSNSSIKGGAYKGEILLSDHYFKYTDEKKAKIYFEELMHLDSGKNDFTRQFQDVLISEWYKAIS